MTPAFHVIVEKDEDGWYVGTVSELPGCHTQAKSLDQLRDRIREAIRAYLGSSDERKFITSQRLTAAMAAQKATIVMENPRLFRAHGYTGAEVPIHFPKEGESRVGPGPMEMMLLGVGGCTAIDIVDILQKERETVEAFRVEMESEKATELPHVFTKIHMKYVLRGNVKDANVQRAIDLSMEKYCSASIMLKRGGVDVTTSYEIERTDSH